MVPVLVEQGGLVHVGPVWQYMTVRLYWLLQWNSNPSAPIGPACHYVSSLCSRLPSYQVNVTRTERVNYWSEYLSTKSKRGPSEKLGIWANCWQRSQVWATYMRLSYALFLLQSIQKCYQKISIKQCAIKESVFLNFLSGKWKLWIRWSPTVLTKMHWRGNTGINQPANTGVKNVANIWLQHPLLRDISCIERGLALHSGKSLLVLQAKALHLRIIN